jgi:hypothetical protein
MKDVEVKQTKNGRSYLSGKCKNCDCRVNCFLKKEKSEKKNKLNE